MKEYIKYRIIDENGNSIGKQDLYETLVTAKFGTRHCRWRLDKNSKIVKIKLTEEIVEEIPINIKRDNTNTSRTIILSFGKKEKEKPTGITFE